MTINNWTLVKIASIGGIATVALGYMTQVKIQNNITETSFFKESMKLVRSHPAAVHLFGEPIRVGRIDVGNNKKNFIDGNQAQFEVPLKAPKQKGTMFLYVKKKDEDLEWSLDKIELEFKNQPNKRLIIRKPES
ncbi:cytochrome c oxidase assembly factor 1 homolog [Anthonomus grandis grandis]|uniref:cytochrome c oxidase assembly factor 1 homolog n=1 Tax=Anthonomus grandis grandis TaxID=2921223 RepID=UPI002165C170|nr:cytochrome c oxidase assembly factor 1 homolog [Anthonomus grandis grandis]